jgi:transcriptional regulator with GAF, ATPase, and Fis domain
VASAPAHAVSSRDLFHRANEALLRAKADGKNRVCVYKEERGAWGHDGSAAATIGTQPEGPAQEQGVPGRDVRSVAQIEILHDLSDKLIRVRDPRAIGRVVREELRDVVGYHRCLIYLVDATGRALVPLLTDVDSDAETGPSEDSAIPLGTGVVGRAVATGRTINVRASSRCELSPFPESSGGTESSLAVPLRYGDRVTGAIALCKRGAAQFDRDDERMVEIVSSTAAIALENARLLLGAEGRNHSAPEWPRRTS